MQNKRIPPIGSGNDRQEQEFFRQGIQKGIAKLDVEKQ
jgi:hypothetical protein